MNYSEKFKEALGEIDDVVSTHLLTLEGTEQDWPSLLVLVEARFLLDIYRQIFLYSLNPSYLLTSQFHLIL